MKYTPRNIKEYKGRLIRLSHTHYRNRFEYNKSITGVITATTRDHIVFNVSNEEPEIFLKYLQITNIEILKRSRI